MNGSNRSQSRLGTLLPRLMRERAGNVMPMVAAGVLPLLAMVGSGIDMGRSYLSQSRLQQACDAGVLAARKKLGTDVQIEDGVTPEAENLGQRFFNINFRAGAYGTEDRDFAMELEDDYSVTGTASVTVPTSIMQIFGYEEVPVTVNCSAQLNMNNTDIMFVLDTTASMALTNPDDAKPRIDVLRDTVKAFHGIVEGNKSTGTRIRYGFVPYSTNVNVGGLLKSSWLVDEWTYQTRVAKGETVHTVNGNGNSWQHVKTDYISGSYASIPSQFMSSCPAHTVTSVYSSYTHVPSSNPPERWYTALYNGKYYYCEASDNGYFVSGYDYTNYLEKHTQKNLPNQDYTWTERTYDYLPVEFDVTDTKDADGNAPTNIWGTISNKTDDPDSPSLHYYYGCIEERGTYEITDYTNVNLNVALDLNLDKVPEAGDEATKWRPMFAGIAYDRGIDWYGNGSFIQDPVLNTTAGYVAPDWIDSEYECPSASKKLAETNAEDIADYVDNLETVGNTYHDIGMIWGGRLISPTGLFASENANANGRPTNRHLIFLTDGETAPLDIMHSSYGVEPLDKRRWSQGSSMSLMETVEKRFLFACNEVRKKNVTIWVISFGTEMTDLMTQCAGDSAHAMQADNAQELSEAFIKIAGSLADLRINR